MMGTEQSAYKDFVIARTELALLRLRNNPAYIERCRQQEKGEEKVDKLLHKLNKRERNAIRRHYEGETIKQSSWTKPICRVCEIVFKSSLSLML